MPPTAARGNKDPVQNGDELAKMQFLEDMTYTHDGWTGRMKRWHYDIFVDWCGGDNLCCPRVGEYQWNEEDVAIAEVDRHTSLGHIAYIIRSPDYTDTEIAADCRKARIDYDKHDVAHRSVLSAAWYELPDDVYSVLPYDHAHRKIE